MIKHEFSFDADEQNFINKVVEASNQHPIMVDFWAEWCPPCRALTPILEKLTTESEGIFHLAKVEVDDNMHLAGQYGLRGFPTVILFIDGEEKARFSGFLPESQVGDFLAQNGVDI